MSSRTSWKKKRPRNTLGEGGAEVNVMQSSGPTKILAFVGVGLALVAVLMLKANTQKATTPGPVASVQTSNTTSLTFAHNDATADFSAATKSGKPIYVLFHSLS
jgi:hypothetical protein